MDNQVKFQGIILGATLGEHLDNLFRSTKLQKLNTFLVEIKSLRDPLEMSHSRYNIRISRERVFKLKFINSSKL